jgi:hypothetical protein
MPVCSGHFLFTLINDSIDSGKVIIQNGKSHLFSEFP